MKPSTDNINIPLDTNGFPMDGVPDKIKNEREYGKKFAEAIYSYWNGAKWGGAMRFGNNVGWNGIRDWYDEKRAYMFGMQDPAKYDRKFSLPQGQDGVEGDGQTGVNFDRRVFQIANKYMRILVSMMTDSQPTLEVNPGDVFSTDKMQERKYLDLSKIINKPIIMAAQAAIGIEPQESPEQPQSPDEVILYEMLGGYKPSFALAMQTALQASLNVVNDFEEVLYDIVQKDIIPVGLAATSTHMDSGGIVRFERVAPEDLIIPFSDKNDFSDMPWVGRIRMLTMTELKQKAGNEFTDEEYDHIEHTCLTSSWTPIKNQNRVMTGDANVSSRGIPCLEFQFYTSNTINYRKKDFADTGNSDVEKKSDTWKPREGDKTVSALRKTYKCVYSGWWILGTDYIFNYGKMPNQPMRGLGDNQLTIKVCAPLNMKMRWNSLVDEIMPDIDMVQMSYRKWIQLVSRIQPDGIAMLDSWLDNTSGPSGVMDKAELLKNFMATGILSLAPPNPEYDSYGGTGIPIVPIPMSNREPMLAATEALLTSIGHLERKLGFNDATNAATMEKDSLVRIQQMQAMGTLNAIKPLIKCLDRLTEMSGDAHASLLIQAARGGGDNEYYSALLGDYTWDMLKELSYDVSLRNINVRVLKRMSAEDRAMLEQQIQLQMQISEQGGPGIDLEDAIMIRREAKNNLAKAQWMLAVKKRIRKQEAAKAAQAQMEQQMQMQQAQAQGQTEGKVMAINAKAQADVQKGSAINQMKSQSKQGELMLKSQAERERIILESQLDLQKAIQELTVKLQDSREKRLSDKEDKRMDRMMQMMSMRPMGKPGMGEEEGGEEEEGYVEEEDTEEMED